MTDDEITGLRQRAELFASRSVDSITLSTSDVLELCDDLDDARDTGAADTATLADLEDENEDLRAQVADLEKALSELGAQARAG